MEILKFWRFTIPLLGALLAATLARADMAQPEVKPPDPAVVPPGMRFCDSAKEFKQAFTLIRSDADLSLNDPQAIQLALKIAAGCDGAAKRFGRIYLLLKKAGVAQAQALNTALTFSALSDQRVDAFIEIFKKVFLANYLNLDFANAYRLSLDLSRDYKGNAKKLSDDFVKLTDFCLSNSGLALDFKNCAELVQRLTRHTDMFAGGVFPEFKKIYEFLRFNKKTGLSIRESLIVIPRVLAKGEKAPTNFVDTMTYLLSKGPLQGSSSDAMKLSLWVADLSLRPEAKP